MRYVPLLLLFWMTFFCFVNPSSTVAQSSFFRLRQTADSLERVGNIEEAIHEYKRLLFLNENFHETPSILFKTAWLNEKAGYLSEAVVAYKQCAGLSTNLSLQKEAVYRSVLCQFLEGKMAEAINDTEPWAQQTYINENYKTPYIYLSDTGIKKIIFLRLICLNEVYRMNDALTEVKKFFPEDKHLALDSIYAHAQKKLSGMKSENRAELYSLFPGGGQWYVGNKKDAIVSVIMVSTLAVGTLTALWYRHYLLGAFGILPIGQKFYNGGRQYAKKLASEYNNRLRNEVSQSLNLFLLQLSTKDH